ncbi:MAG: autotransporter domain-containing protein, partial [Telmatospirillum sp.]|nr:autotransporter domain-containing protein [Telmatospirillum sp.]
MAAGTLAAGAANAFSAASLTSVGSPATLDLGGYGQSLASLYGGGTVTNSGTSGATLSVGSGAFAGALQDGTTSSLALAKTGSGVLHMAFGASNSYSGATTVAAGTLEADTANTFSPNSATTVAGGATLAFAGDQSIASLAGTGTVTNLGTGSATLSVGAGNSSTVFSGV